MADLTSVDFVKKQSEKLSSTEQAAEYWNCRRNPFYFIFNYSYIPEVGGILKYEESMMHDKMKQVIKSLYNYHRVILMATRQLGKALFIKTLIPTPDGYKRLEDLHINDYVLDEFERPTKILAETPIQENRPCYLVKFSNNESVIADANHLWKVTIPEYDPVHERLFITRDLYYMSLQGMSQFIIGKGYQNVNITEIRKCRSAPVKCIQVNNQTGMYLITKKHIPTHNSTIAANILEWVSNFYPNFQSTILNMTKKAAFENLDKIKSIHAALPEFLRTPLKFKGERKTTLDYTNGSIVRIFYPSSTTQPSTLARSFTSPGLYIDEAAFINHIDIAYTAAQPTLSRAREQARKHSYPWFKKLIDPIIRNYY